MFLLLIPATIESKFLTPEVSLLANGELKDPASDNSTPLLEFTSRVLTKLCMLLILVMTEFRSLKFNFQDNSTLLSTLVNSFPRISLYAILAKLATDDLQASELPMV